VLGEILTDTVIVVLNKIKYLLAFPPGLFLFFLILHLNGYVASWEFTFSPIILSEMIEAFFWMFGLQVVLRMQAVTSQQKRDKLVCKLEVGRGVHKKDWFTVLPALILARENRYFGRTAWLRCCENWDGLLCLALSYLAWMVVAMAVQSLK
jgi:hypothetical protein